MSNELRFPGQWGLTPATRELLMLFVERAAEFRSVGAFGFPVEATVGVRADGVVFSEAELPSEKDLRVAAQIARHFYLQKEPLLLGRICNVLYSSTAEDRFRTEIARVRESFNAALARPLNPTTGDPGIVTRRHLIDAYFNGDLFHSDPQERAFVRAQQSSPWGPLHRQAFAQALMEIYGHVLALLPTVENALGVDQLAPCATSKGIQTLLAEHALGPAPITIAECRNCATTPPVVGLRCEIDLHVPESAVGRVASFALALMREDRPGYAEYAVWWRNEAGELNGVCG